MMTTENNKEKEYKKIDKMLKHIKSFIKYIDKSTVISEYNKVEMIDHLWEIYYDLDADKIISMDFDRIDKE